MLLAVGLWASLLVPIAWAADAPDVAADPALEARVNALAAELRCLVCQNESLASSNAELAVDLRREVRGLIERNKIFIQRTKDISVVSADMAIAYGWTGPCGRLPCSRR